MQLSFALKPSPGSSGYHSHTAPMDSIRWSFSRRTRLSQKFASQNSTIQCARDKMVEWDVVKDKGYVQTERLSGRAAERQSDRQADDLYYSYAPNKERPKENWGKGASKGWKQRMEKMEKRTRMAGKISTGCRMRHGGATPMRLQFMFVDKMGFAFCFWLLVDFDLDILLVFYPLFFVYLYFCLYLYWYGLVVPRLQLRTGRSFSIHFQFVVALIFTMSGWDSYVVRI